MPTLVDRATDLTDVLDRLRAVRHLRFESRSAAGTGWDGVGTGRVSVNEPEPGVLVFEERGHWQAAAPGREPTAFRNVFRWSALPSGALRLEHLRHGPDRPVYLFDMAPTAEGPWREIEAHQCAADRYAATLVCEGPLLRVGWTIAGPRKREAIHYTYGPGPGLS